jgi:hypothetical protein
VTTVGLRLRVRLHRWRLDRELADGGVRDGSDAHALRARQLSDPTTRRRLSGSLRRLVADAEKAGRALPSATLVRREAVIGWREALLGLAERLERPAAVNPRGIARVLVLLTDGSSPFYSAGAERSVGDAVWWVADGLAPCPPHRWGCPVIMKADPEQVAWTCGRCGAITTTDDPAARPA